jgi:hypothetical protein
MKLNVSERLLLQLEAELRTTTNPVIAAFQKRLVPLAEKIRADRSYKARAKKDRLSLAQFIAVYEEVPGLIYDLGTMTSAVRNACGVRLNRSGMSITGAVLLRDKLRAKGGSYNLFDILAFREKATSRARRSLVGA